MRPFSRIFGQMFASDALDPEARRRLEIDRQWQQLRDAATSPSEREEIDAIFSRAV